MKIVSFNANSIRMRNHQLATIIANHDPDFIGIQETKVRDEEFPLEAINALGYHAIYHGQKTHYGVALLSKKEPISVQKGYPDDDDNAQRRFIAATFKGESSKPLTIINGYFPQGENQKHETKFPAKRKFYADLNLYINKHHTPSDNLIIMGDINISPEDIDIGIGEDNRKRWLQTKKCSFLPEERQWLKELLDWGLFDTFRQHNPKQDLYSWFDYRSKGFDKEPKRGLRIDAILATKNLADQCNASGIDYEVRAMEKPSDHAPIWSYFNPV